MKRNKITILLMTIMIAFLSCNNNGSSSIDEPDQIGEYVFDIIKNISSVTKQKYIDNFISTEEIRELGKNSEVIKDEKSRNKMTSVLKEEWVNELERNYNKVKERAAKYGIIWNDIQYLDYVYEINEKRGIKTCEGKLYFKYKDDSFKIRTSSIFNGHEYKLIEIRSLQKQ